MKLEELVGNYLLDAVDFSEETVKDNYGDGFEHCSVCRFRINSVVYIAAEDPADGYRSTMSDLKEDKEAVMKNTFPPVEVIGKYRDKGKWGNEDDIIEFIDVKTGKIVLEIGTENTDDYYPCYVASFHPEAMAINIVK
jgi:hypothetical protein